MSDHWRVGSLVGQQGTLGRLLGSRFTATGSTRAHSTRSATPSMSRGAIRYVVTLWRVARSMPRRASREALRIQDEEAGCALRCGFRVAVSTPRSSGGRQGRLKGACEDMIRIGWRRRPGRWRGLAVAFVVATLVSGCAPLRTVCVPGTWAPTTAEVTWSPGPHGSGSVPAMSCEAAPK